MRADLARDRAALARIRVLLVREQRLVALLRTRLARAKMLLARQLVSAYEGDKPDLVGVVLEAQGFNDLLNKLAFLRRAEGQQQSLIKLTEAAKAAADSAERRLAKLEAIDLQQTTAAATRARALAGMNALLQSKQNALARARAAQRLALAASQARGGRLRSAIARLQAQQAAAQRAAAAAATATPTASGPTLRPQRRLGDPVRDRAVRVRRPEPVAKQRRRVGLLPDHAGHLEAVRGHRARRVPGQQGRAGRRGQAHLERWRGRPQLGLRRHRRHQLIATI